MQIVVTSSPSVHATSAQDIANDALPLALARLDATLSDAQMRCDSLGFISELEVDELHRTVCPPIDGCPEQAGIDEPPYRSGHIIER